MYSGVNPFFIVWSTAAPTDTNANAIILPRQAQDKHRESTQNTRRFEGFLDPSLNSSKSFAEDHARLEAMREEFDISVCTQHAGDLLYVTHSRTHALTHSRTQR